MTAQTLRPLGLGCALLAGLLPGRAAAQFEAFTWTFSSPGGTGSGVVTSAEMTIVGPDAGFSQCPGSTNAFTSVAPYDLLLSADFDIQNLDKGGIDYDYLVTLVDGVETKVSGQCYDCQVVLQVPAGSSFGFGVHSVDCIAGEAVATLTKLALQPAPQAIVTTGTEAGAQFGAAVTALDDVDGDGAAEAAVGAPLALGGKGRVTVHLGSSMAIVRVILGAAAGDRFGSTLAPAGDLDGDSLSELAVGAPLSDAGGHDSGAVRIYSAGLGPLLSTLPGAAAGDHFGSAIADAGDVDGDGVDDLLIGAPDHDGPGADAGQAVLLSGATGATLRTWSGAAAGDGLGRALAGVGDANGDGTPDVAIGSPGSDLVAIDAGLARVYSGATGDGLHVLAYAPCGGQSHDGFGSAIAGLGDVDGDGVPDVVAGAPTASCGTAWAGTALVFSGLDGHALYGLKGKQTAAQFGFALDAAGDLDANGGPDLIVGAPTGNVSPEHAGAVELVSGADGALLLAAGGSFPADAFGRAVAGVGDTDADGFADVLVGSPAQEVAGSPGTATLLRPHILWADLGHALAGTLGSPTLEATGLLAPGTPVSLTLGSTAPGLPVTLILGLEQLGAAFKGGVLVPQPDLLVTGLVSASPELALAGHLPAGLPPGTELLFQMWIADAAGPKGLAASNGLRGDLP